MSIHNPGRPGHSNMIQGMSAYLAEERPLSHHQGLPLYKAPPVIQNSP